MKVVVDTSAWIEWLLRSPSGYLVNENLPDDDDWIVPTVVLMELAKWLFRERSRDDANNLLVFVESLHVIDLDAEIALVAAEFCRDHKLATADAVIYATAVLNGAVLMTCDAHFRELPGVRYVPKARH